MTRTKNCARYLYRFDKQFEARVEVHKIHSFVQSFVADSSCYIDEKGEKHFQRYLECERWCNENLKHRYCLFSDHIYFRSKEDAVKFKLTFGGKN